MIPFRVESERIDDEVIVLTVSGELDLDTAPALEEPLEQALAEPTARILLDLSGCEFMDSTGVALIVRAWQRHDEASGNGGRGRLTLCCANSQVGRLLEVTGLGSSIPTHRDREAALAELGR